MLPQAKPPTVPAPTPSDITGTSQSLTPPFACQPDPENVKETVAKLFSESVGDLSVVARTLERWPVYTVPVGVPLDRVEQERQKFLRAESKGRQRVAEHLKRFAKRQRKVCELLADSRAYDQANLPQDLIDHVDGFLSPNLWLKGLVNEVEYNNDIARGELTALGAMHSSLQFYLKTIDGLKGCVRIPDFTLAAQPPMAFRPKVLREEKAVSLMHVLKLLSQPITPYDLRQHPKELNQISFPPLTEEPNQIITSSNETCENTTNENAGDSGQETPQTTVDGAGDSRKRELDVSEEPSGKLLRIE